MSKIRKPALLAALAAPAALAVALAMPASAAPGPNHPARPDAPTAACEATLPGQCLTPVVAQSVLAAHNLIPADDAGMTVPIGAVNNPVNGTPVRVNPDADLETGQQDWTPILVDVVPVTGSGAYLYTPFDNFHYAGRGVYALEFTPFGQDTGQCIQPTKRDVKFRGTDLTLQECDGGADQAFIATTTAPFVSPAPAGYTYALWVPQAVNNQHHLALTAPQRIRGPVDVQRLVNAPLNKGSNQRWSATS